ncbi:MULTISPECIES: hypothetical protein [unclassified Streptomyces]|uniref:hypothetical protein n=1 Tax=unclassified Streptomyces TaxID=2593676 RepID=UPI0015A398FC|nr:MULTISPECIES: hypothetical protein [unclassified Streptomyces]
MDERGQETVDEHQPVLRTGAHGSLPRPGGRPGLMPFQPQRIYFGQEFSDRIGRQARDPPIADDCRTVRIPHHATVIDDQELIALHRQPCTSSSGEEPG